MTISEEKLLELSKNIKILYVEDDMEIAKQLGIFLRKFIKNLDITHNGEDALNLYFAKKHDIVITDLKLPKLNGIAMIEKIRAINKKTIFIVTSAYASSQYLIKLIDMGIASFAPKPFNMKKLLFAISEALKNVHENQQVYNIQQYKDNTLELYRNVLENVKTPMLFLNSEKIEYFNTAFKKTFYFKDYEELTLSDFFEQIQQPIRKSHSEWIKYFTMNNSVPCSLHVRKKLHQEFIINVTSIKNSTKVYMCFFNVEYMKKELDKLQNMIDIDSKTLFFSVLH